MEKEERQVDVEKGVAGMMGAESVLRPPWST